jgi:FixJ family two-component response regulator
MPGLNGAELRRVVFSRFPRVAAVVITGQRDFLSRPFSSGPGRVFDILRKPIDGDQLLRTVARALERGRVAREIERRRPATR